VCQAEDLKTGLGHEPVERHSRVLRTRLTLLQAKRGSVGTAWRPSETQQDHALLPRKTILNYKFHASCRRWTGSTKVPSSIYNHFSFIKIEAKTSTFYRTLVRPESAHIRYYVFDLLMHEHRDLTERCLSPVALSLNRTTEVTRTSWGHEGPTPKAIGQQFIDDVEQIKFLLSATLVFRPRDEIWARSSRLP
jgi:hypothetical protein